MLNNKKGLLATILGCLFLSLGAQNTNSPYSRYGYGILKDNSIGASKSMGGISYGLRSGQNVNSGNPASYSNVDSLTFIFDIGINYSKAQLSDPSGSQWEDNGGLDYIAMLMPLSKKIGFSLGILPYSSVGYSFGSVDTSGNTSYIKAFSGSGGISQLYGGVAYAPFENLSIGANAYYMFGSMKHTRSIPSLSPSGYLVSDNKTLRYNTVRFDLGLQYSHPLTVNNILTLGAVFSPKMNATAKYEGLYKLYYVVATNSGSQEVVVDSKEVSEKVDAAYPNSYGLGFTLTHKKNWLVGADLSYQQWSKVNYSDLMEDDLAQSERFNDRWKINMGGEYVSDPTSRNYLKRMKFRAGLNYANSYLNVKSKSTGELGGYKEYGATLGFGFPVRDTYTGRTSYINLGFEYLTVRPEISNMIKESYFGVNLNVNINDLWFMKNKFK